MRYTGVTARGIVTPIFQEGDDLVNEIVNSILKASSGEGFSLNDGDIVAVTEAVVGRTQGNYATCEQISLEIKEKFFGEDMGIVFPILSRNRFSMLLKAISMGTKKLYVQLSYPADEVGNELLNRDDMDAKGVNPCLDNFNESEFKGVFGKGAVHKFTGIDYIEHYKSIGDNIEILLSNEPKYILNYTNNVLCCDIHSRFRTHRILKNEGANTYRLDEIMNKSINGSGYNPKYGLLGSNVAGEDKVKLFPIKTDEFVLELQSALKEKTGKHMECMVYGDGGFKDPVGGIWELADPVISPSYTSGLAGTPNEIKIKYIADDEFSEMSGEELIDAIKSRMREKDKTAGEINKESVGTTPRQIPDLVGSLSDLVSGSGDRGTPVVLIQNYFSNYAAD
ncbi:MAG: F420-0--gamma-glutamyl ligase [Ruminococcaceae bacterium]|nr:F420-0--gamma-glutamyl ligase [Oscillospiraceae bacterium]